MTVATLVLLHGQPGAGFSLWPLRSALRSRLGDTVEIITPDRPGYGTNPRPATDFAGNATWLGQVLRTRRDAPVFVLAHSWAGGAAVLAAARAENKLAGLILLASIGPDCLLRSDRWLARPVIGEAAALLALKLGRPVVMRAVVPRTLAAIDEDLRPFAAAPILASRRRPIWRSFLQEQRTLVDQLPSINSALGKIAVPTLVINGTSDAVIPAVTARELVRRIPAAEPVLLPAAGHDLHVERAAEVGEHVARFLRRQLDRCDQSAAAR